MCGRQGHIARQCQEEGAKSDPNREDTERNKAAGAANFGANSENDENGNNQGDTEVENGDRRGQPERSDDGSEIEKREHPQPPLIKPVIIPQAYHQPRYEAAPDPQGNTNWNQQQYNQGYQGRSDGIFWDQNFNNTGWINPTMANPHPLVPVWCASQHGGEWYGAPIGQAHVSQIHHQYGVFTTAPQGQSGGQEWYQNIGNQIEGPPSEIIRADANVMWMVGRKVEGSHQEPERDEQKRTDGRTARRRRARSSDAEIMAGRRRIDEDKRRHQRMDSRSNSERRSDRERSDEKNERRETKEGRNGCEPERTEKWIKRGKDQRPKGAEDDLRYPGQWKRRKERGAKDGATKEPSYRDDRAELQNPGCDSKEATACGNGPSGETNQTLENNEELKN